MSSAGAALTVHFHGTRGSVPTPGPHAALCGGNTSCIEIESAGGRRIILDAGTGLRRVARPRSAGPLDLFLTHFHWDHVQGLPFLTRFGDGAAAVRIHAPRQPGVELDDLLGARLAPVYFPVPLRELAVGLRMRALEDGAWQEDGLQVTSARVAHPSRTHGLRVRQGDVVIAYIPDNELVPGTSDYERASALAEGADLLVHDAMYTTAEHAARRGWGHSTFAEAVRLAERAGARALRLFHHHPDRSDAALLRILAAIRRDLERRGSALDVDIAREGESLTLPSSH